MNSARSRSAFDAHVDFVAERPKIDRLGQQGLVRSAVAIGGEIQADVTDHARELDSQFRGDYYSLLRASRKLTMLHLTQWCEDWPRAGCGQPG